MFVGSVPTKQGVVRQKARQKAEAQNLCSGLHTGELAGKAGLVHPP